MTKIDIKRPMWVKMTAYGFAAVLFASATIGGLAWYSQSAMNERAVLKEFSSDLDVLEADMDAQRRAASALALTLAGEPDMAGLIANDARDALLAKYSGSLANVNATSGLGLITFTQNGVVVARAHAPDKFGDDIKNRRKMIVATLKEGKLNAGIEPGRTSVNMFASAPVIGNSAGIVDVGSELSEAYFSRIAEKTDSHIAIHIFSDGKFETQASTFNDATMLTPEQIQAAFDGDLPITMMATSDHDYAVAGKVLESFSGEKIGVIEMASNVTPIVAAGRSATTASIVGTILVSLLSLLGFFFYARAFSGTIRKTTETMTRLASGDLAAVVGDQNRPDEVGAMARAVQVFKEAGLEKIRLEQEADAQRNLSEEERNRNSDEERVRARQMQQATSGLGEGLKHLAAGNLSFQLTEPFAADFEGLRTDFNDAVSQLGSTLRSVAEASIQIATGSTEISQSAQDLSKRTEQQAASLEETAAALDQITANVANSTKRVEEATTAAEQANQSAVQSGTIVSNAVDAMGRIEQSASQISNIIGVIDEIAFQTNLLALNAGVEAARAGEAGRGFAVVAQEVRELAQRSAQAAKEIKDLIRNSTVEVEGGVRLVNETGEALKTIETYIVTVNEHMKAIAHAAKEQSVGLGEVNIAVNQMDQVTQQNAAMVEENTAASTALSTEAGQLGELIGQFRLDGSAGHGAAALRRTATAMSQKASPVKRSAMQGNLAVKSDEWTEF
ncbi:MAG: HAMP domain-containing protein [Hoeflea sp.]|uniref:methyl-accepting chemotaxis protein n=1 Tax=Hoeflea sp. TaxID=1940281 RepID=UPI001DE01CC4|nr:methyl-accepting chemotaxis protein [Hoeflea sp.]MBU4528284.1 HAMP domain-containing protein [Alphaproteobacteria bacterium]MBU4543880.1 HAMP domain-containing protein [Alphaproteobacteria bacterium]MBU4548521.1 HAMP domain-containing protein [Alphaproteobacteria bacterium]MBV1722600.1 HAMP domain-containing protein [Hoeflea sp.]MBV1762269.1 HAMP domain-containing protein [Hoeflea sp.]